MISKFKIFLGTNLNSLQVRNFNFVQGDDQEWRFGKLYNRVRCWLDQNVGSVGNTVKTNFSEWNVNVDSFILSSVRDLLRKGLELSVKSSTASSFLLLSFEFLFISEALASSVTGLIKLHLSGFTIELHVFGLAFANHDRGFKMHMDDHNKLMCAWLEEEVLHVAEQDVNVFIPKR